LKNKYDGYAVEVGQAQEAVAYAQAEADKLELAINEIDKIEKKDDTVQFENDAEKKLASAATKKFGKGLTEDQIELFGKDGVIVAFGLEEYFTEDEIVMISDMSTAEALTTVRNKLDFAMMVAKLKLDSAYGTLEEVQEMFNKAGEDLERTVERLTPSEDDTPAGGGATTPGTDATGDEGTTGAAIAAGTGLISPMPAQLPAQNQGVLGARVNRNRSNKTGAVTDEGTGLTKKVDAVNNKPAETKKNNTVENNKEKRTVTINGQKVALAGTLDEEDAMGMNLIWLFIIAALGATGYAMYKKSQENKAVAEASGSVNETKSDK
nr:hypothetical protein [Lachnospiraceae bacterium]